jgi:hypothetical protein
MNMNNKINDKKRFWIHPWHKKKAFIHGIKKGKQIKHYATKFNGWVEVLIHIPGTYVFKK